MKKQNLLMLLAVMGAIFAFTTVSAQADLVTDFTDFYDTGSLYAPGNVGIDFATNSPGSGDITISGFIDSGSSGTEPVGMEGLYTNFEFNVGDRVAINWDGYAGNLTTGGELTAQGLGLRFAGASGYNIIIWDPYDYTIHAWSDAGGFYDSWNYFSSRPAVEDPGNLNQYSLYIEKKADGYTLGSIIDGVEHIMGSGLASNMGAENGGLFADLRNPDQQWLVSLDMPVPEPATMALLGLGGLGLIRRRRSR